MTLLDAIRRPFRHHGGAGGAGVGGADAVPQYDDVIDEHIASPIPSAPSAHASSTDEDEELDGDGDGERQATLDSSRVASILSNHYDVPGLARSGYDCRRVSRAFLVVATIVGALVGAAFVVSRFFPPLEIDDANIANTGSSGSAGAGGGGGLKEPPYDISVVCSASYTQLQDGYDECRSMCAPASCCFTDDDDRNCFDDNEDLCFMYESCANLDLDDDGFYDQDEGSGSPTGHHHVVVPAAPSNLADICSPENTSSPDGNVICRDVCLVAACCWQHGESMGSCYEQNHEACLGYAGCFGSTQGERDHTLHNHDPAAEEVPDHTVNELCRRDNPLGLDACVDLCSSRMCCFAQGQASCAVKRKRECITYAACGIVSSTASVPQGQPQQPKQEPTLTAPPPDLDSICEADGLTTEGRFELCRATCGPSMCCGERSPPTDCIVEMCAAWGACTSVWGSP